MASARLLRENINAPELFESAWRYKYNLPSMTNVSQAHRVNAVALTAYHQPDMELVQSESLQTPSYFTSTPASTDTLFFYWASRFSKCYPYYIPMQHFMALRKS